MAKISCHVCRAEARGWLGFWLLTWQHLVDVILFPLNIWLILIQGSIVGCCVHRVRTVHVIVELLVILLIIWDSEGAQVWQERAKAW